MYIRFHANIYCFWLPTLTGSSNSVRYFTVISDLSESIDLKESI